ncbi:MAG: hypothetical protein PWQ25_1062 [Deferribacteres bacterium]|jgi:drug/metabolite transporter (DMT)-like permease|nr:drug/metabolite transporter [Deferribacteraceae bacterium]MDK2792199.1 hypothetical protein [Deferribacteres bacterium]
MNRRLLEYSADISLLFISIIWGSTFIIVKEAVNKIDPVVFLSYRFFFASLLLFPFLFLRKNKISLSSVYAGLVMGFVMFLVFYLQTVGLMYVSASKTGFLTGLYIVFVPLFSFLFLKKKPYPTSIIGVILSIIGLYFISFKGKVNFGKGEFLILLNAIGIAIHIILTDFYSRKYDAMILTVIQITVTALLSTFVSFATNKNIYIQLNNETIFAFILTGFFATVLAFFIQTAMQKYTTPTKAAILFTLEPVSAAFFGYFIGKEILTFNQYVGALIIILAMLTSEIGSAIIGVKK